MKQKYSIRKTSVGVGSLMIGLSMLTTPLLSIHANQVSSDSVSGVTMEEISAINRFLEEKPIDKKLTTLGTTNPATVVDDYKFPTDGSHKSFLYSLGTPIRLTEDKNKFKIVGSDDIVKIKDIEQVEFYSLPSGYFPSYVVAKQITVVDGNGTEEIINNPVFDWERSRYSHSYDGYSDFSYIAKDQFIADFPIELHDPRLKVTTYDISKIIYWHGDQIYWGIYIPYLEELPYDTVVQIDEKLKSGEVIVDSPGKFGKKTIDFKVLFDLPAYQKVKGTVNASNYMDFTSDRLVNETRELGKQWSKPNEEIGSLVDAQHTILPKFNKFILSEDRRLRVGIDYTHFVDTEGNTLSETEYGLKELKEIPGYIYKDTREEENGDSTHIYTKDPVAGGNVTVKYVDGAGNTISDNVVKSGNIGDSYTTEQKSIPGYTFKEVQGSASGKFTAQDQTVYYVYTKNAPTITTDKKTVNETIHYQGAGNQTPADHTASVDFTRQVSTDAVTGEKTYGAWSEAQSFDAGTSPELKGYTADKAQIDKQTVNGDSKDLEFTVTYTKNAPTITTDLKHQLTPGNPSQPSYATNNGAVNSPELPQTGESNSQSQTMSFIGILLAMFGSLLGFLGIKKRRND